MLTQTKIKRLAKKIGVKLSNRDAKKSYLWNGKTIGIKNLSHSNQLHEIAHWLTVTPEMREMVDFGLGPGPESRKRSKPYVSEKKCKRYEEEASLLGIAYEAYFELPFIETWSEHRWKFDDLFWIIVHSLNDKGLLQGHLPTIT